jgi:hypothetical protein
LPHGRACSRTKLHKLSQQRVNPFMTANVRRALAKMMAQRDWTTAGHGWQGKTTMLRLLGWSRQRRVVLLRRKLDRPLALVDRTEPGAAIAQLR